MEPDGLGWKSTLIQLLVLTGHHHHLLCLGLKEKHGQLQLLQVWQWHTFAPYPLNYLVLRLSSWLVFHNVKKLQLAECVGCCVVTAVNNGCCVALIEIPSECTCSPTFNVYNLNTISQLAKTQVIQYSH